MQKLIQQRAYPCFIGHIHVHSSLPGPLAQGNQAIDQLLVAPIEPTSLLQTQQSHAQLHQHANSLRKQFHLTREQAH